MVAIGVAMLAGCGGAKHRAGASHRGGSINVAIVDTPNTEDLERLTPSLFTSASHIRVNYTKLDEGTLRDVVTSDLTGRGRQFDVVMIGPYEAPQYAEERYISDLTSMASSDRAYELGDIIPSIRTALSYRSRLYASPFYGESSFLMYRKDVLRDDARAPDVGAGGGDRAQGRRAEDGRHLPARKGGLGGARRLVHDGAQHVRGHVVVRDPGWRARQIDGRSAGVPQSARVLRRPDQGRGRA
jgi:hypothetical protein